MFDFGTERMLHYRAELTTAIPRDRPVQAYFSFLHQAETWAATILKTADIEPGDYVTIYQTTETSLRTIAKPEPPADSRS